MPSTYQGSSLWIGISSATFSGSARPRRGTGSLRISETMPSTTVLTVKLIQKKLKAIRTSNIPSITLMPSPANQPWITHINAAVATIAGLKASTRHSATPCSGAGPGAPESRCAAPKSCTGIASGRSGGMI